MLQHLQSDCVSVIIVIQTRSEIVSFNLGDPKYFEFLTKKSQKMIQLPLQRGPYEQFYFGVVDENGFDSLICVSFENKEGLTLRTAQRCKETSTKIISFQVENRVTGEYEGEFDHRVYLLDSTGSLKRILNKDYDFVEDYRVSYNLSWHLEITDIIKSLLQQQSSWHRVILNKASIIAMKDVQFYYYSLPKLKICGTNSQLSENLRSFHFEELKQYKRLKQGLTEPKQYFTS